MRGTLLFHILCFCSFTILIEGQLLQFLDETSEIIKDSATVTKEWEKMQNVLKHLVKEGTSMIMRAAIDDVQRLNITPTCVRDSIHVFSGIRRLKTWAMRFVDASAKGIDGALTGTPFSLGSYDECLDTVAPAQRFGINKGKPLFTGKYCILRIKVPLPPKNSSYKMGDIMDELKDLYKKDTFMSEVIPYAPLLYYFSGRLGLCIPSGCTVDDMNQLFAIASNYTGLHLKVRRCEVKESPKFTPMIIFVISLYSFMGFIVLSCTAVEAYCYYFERKLDNSISTRALLAFSVISNMRKFLDTSTSSQHLSCLNGIRFITLSWVILGHTYAFPLYFNVGNLEYLKDIVQEFAMQAIVNASVAVDTFFFMGGLLVCYVATRFVVVSKMRFSVTVYILHRFWRIVPVYTFVILTTFLADIIISGPAAHDAVGPIVESCRNNWWASLLFINTYYRPTGMCIPHGWYLSLDVQFYIAALVILLPLFRWPKVGITIGVVSAVGFMVACGVITYLKNFPPTPVVSSPNVELLLQWGIEFYIKPYPHASPYIIGILVGYLLAVNPSFKIPRWVQLLGWSAATVCCLSSLYGVYEWNLGREPTFWETMFYSSCFRVAWILGIAWTIVCCATGHGGIVNYMLSWKIWIPLGRLSFLAYLIHPLVQLVIVGSYRNMMTPMHVLGVWYFFANLMATYGIALIMSMLIESPFFAFEKIILSTHEEKMKKAAEKEVALSVIEGGIKEKNGGSPNCNSQLSQSQDGIENSGFVCRF